MSRQYVMECVVDLPDDPHESSEVVVKTKEPRDALIAALNSSEVKFEHRSYFRSKLPRKPREHPGILLAASNPPEAAE